MDFPIHTDTISMGPPIVHFKGPQVGLSKNYGVFLSLEIVLTLTNSVDPDEMQLLRCISSGSSLFAKVPVYIRGFHFTNV